MQDPLYHSDVAHLAMGYAQPPMTSYFVAPVEKAPEDDSPADDEP